VLLEVPSVLPPFREMWYSLHYKLLVPTHGRGQSTSCGTQEEAGVTPHTFGRLKADESGVAPARFAVFCAVTFVGAVLVNL
jgi:hypothetical protein